MARLGIGLSPLAVARKRAAADWWLSGGVSPSDVVAAYQPKGAASLAASYTNLANPGTYDAAPGIAPLWSSANGWTGSGGSYLRTGILLSSHWSFFVRLSGGPTIERGIFGVFLSGCNTYFYSGTGRYISGGGNFSIGFPILSGVMASSNRAAYLNGILAGTMAAPTGTAATTEMYILAINSNGTAIQPYPGNLQALAVYSAALTAPQVLAISTAMAAL